MTEGCWKRVGAAIGVLIGWALLLIGWVYAFVEAPAVLR